MWRRKESGNHLNYYKEYIMEGGGGAPWVADCDAQAAETAIYWTLIRGLLTILIDIVSHELELLLFRGEEEGRSWEDVSITHVGELLLLPSSSSSHSLKNWWKECYGSWLTGQVNNNNTELLLVVLFFCFCLCCYEGVAGHFLYSSCTFLLLQIGWPTFTEEGLTTTTKKKKDWWPEDAMVGKLELFAGQKLWLSCTTSSQQDTNEWLAFEGDWLHFIPWQVFLSLAYE